MKNIVQQTGIAKRVKLTQDVTDFLPVPLFEQLNSLSPINKTWLLVVPETSVPADDSEVYYCHPIFTSLLVSNHMRFKIGNKQVGKGNGQYLSLNIFVPGPKSYSKIQLMTETFKGLRPSEHHHARVVIKTLPTTASNVAWFCPNQVLDFDKMTLSEKDTWTQFKSPYSTYFYSVYGQVRRGSKIITLKIAYDGYLQVAMQADTGVETTARLHVLIAYSEYGPRPEGFDVAHLDNNKLNCSPSNLKYQTKSDNVRLALVEYCQPVTAKNELGTEEINFCSYKEAGKYFGVYGYQIRKWAQKQCFIALDSSTNQQKWKFELETLAKQKQTGKPAPDLLWLESQITAFKGYAVSHNGMVKHCERNTLVPLVKPGGYYRLRLNGHLFYLHLVILENFFGPRPSDEHKGDHIDENKLHNCRSNLQWTLKNIERSTGRPCQRSLDGTFWETFDSLQAAADMLSKENGTLAVQYLGCLSDILNNRHKTLVCGYQWRGLVRLPDETYICPDCRLSWVRRGKWVEP